MMLKKHNNPQFFLQFLIGLIIILALINVQATTKYYKAVTCMTNMCVYLTNKFTTEKECKDYLVKKKLSDSMECKEFNN